MTFKEAVEKTSDIKAGYRIGLQALGVNKSHVAATDPRKIDGSVDIDKCTRMLYPNSARWDYAIGYDGKAYFLEIHPANTSNVEEMIKKAKWLNEWLNDKAPSLKSLAANNDYYWVPSGKVCILKNSPQYRKLSQSSIRLVSVCRLP